MQVRTSCRCNRIGKVDGIGHLQTLRTDTASACHGQQVFNVVMLQIL